MVLGEKSGGKVYLVGAGPGSVDLLTVQAHRLLSQAQVLVYDALVDDAVLALVPPGCDRHYMGKRGGHPSPSQGMIDQLLVELCHQGHQVIRLKSGDPFIFGRTTSEIHALKQAGCAVEVVPGLSSALVAPLLAGIPLTDTVLSSHFTVLTGHDLDLHNWEALAQMATLVVLMGGRSLPAIAQRLISRGQHPDTPVVVIRWAGQPQQQIWQGTLLTIGQRTRGATLSPCVVVIGQVAGLRQYL